MTLADALKPWLARLDAVPDRDRYAMLAAGLVLLLGVEMIVVLPMHGKREAMLAASTNEAQGVSDAAAAAESDQAQQEAVVTSGLAKVERELANLGVGAAGATGSAGSGRGESLSFLLTRTLQRQTVRVVSLRGLGAEELSVAVPADEAALTAAAAQTSAVATVTNGLTGAPPKAMFRHRYELTLGGDINQLTAAIDALEHGIRPLRIERVRLASSKAANAADAANADPAVQATVTLVTIGLERAWLSL